MEEGGSGQAEAAAVSFKAPIHCGCAGGVRWVIIIVFVAVASLPRCLAVPRSLSFPLNLCPCLPAQLACGIVVVIVVVVVEDKAPQALTAYYKS